MCCGGGRGPEKRDSLVLSGSIMEHCPEEGTFYAAPGMISRVF